MSNEESSDPLTRFDDHYVDDVMYTEDINKKMRVPRRIRVGGESDDDFPNGIPGNHWINTDRELFNMHVPERIVVGGYGQHIGAKAMPRELVLENQYMPKEPESIRVATPPRVITLDKYPYPSIDDRSSTMDSMVPVVTPRSRFVANDQDSSLIHRESTPPIGQAGDGLTPAEEVLHLRRQLARLNRRVMAIELESMQRQQKEKLIYGIGLAYFLIKAILWLNRA